MKDFVLSDESRNSYGMIIITKGINLDNFIKNPVMFYNHNRNGGIIGRWENIRVVGKKLLAKPVFDETDDTGKKIAQKVKDGFIRAASIGVDPTTQDGEIITACELIEVSICDIPSNKNALMLYHNGKPVNSKEEYIKLTKLQDDMNKEDFKKILALLGLKDDSTIDDVIAAIQSLKPDTPESIIENAIRENYIKAYEKPALLNMARISTITLNMYLGDRKRERDVIFMKECKDMLTMAIRDGRLDAPGVDKERLSSLFVNDMEAFKNLLEAIPKRKSITELIRNASNVEGRTGWNLKDYRIKSPRELEKNPELYERLLEEERERKEKKNN